MCGEEDPIKYYRRKLVGKALQATGMHIRHIRREGQPDPLWSPGPVDRLSGVASFWRTQSAYFRER